MSDICNNETCRVLMKHVIPALGALTALLISLSPLPTIRLIEKEKSIDGYNPTPFPMMTLNALSWVFYGLLSRDVYVFLPNFIGVNCGLFYTLVAFKYASGSFRTSATYTLLTGITVILGASFIVFVILSADVATGKLVSGSICVAILVLFYAAPLSSMLHVIRTRDARSINPWLSGASFVNGILWTAYGFAINDGFIWAPNLVGAAFAVIQFILLIVFHKRKSADLETEADEPKSEVPEAVRSSTETV